MTPDQIARILHGRRYAKGKWMAKCPVHRERTASLSITDMGRGNTRLHCFAGCSQLDVIEAAGLQWKDLREKSDWTPPAPTPDWLDHNGPVWFDTTAAAMEMACACASLLAVPEIQRKPMIPIWSKENGSVPDPDSIVRGAWEPRSPDAYVVDPRLRNSVLQGELKRAIISWYRLRFNEKRQKEVQRIIAEYGEDELWECLPKPV